MDPTFLFERRDGVYANDLLIMAVGQLDFFTRLDHLPSSLESLCLGLDLAVRPTEVMLTLFAALGLVRRTDETYEVTELARTYLTAVSPLSLAPYYATLKDRPICPALLEVRRTDRPLGWGAQPAAEDWHAAMAQEDFAAAFTAGMDARGATLAPLLAAALPLAEHQALLDVAGGSGLYACAAVQRQPGLRAAVLEKLPVNHVAREAIARRGLTDRVRVIAGDMLKEPWPRRFDLHLFAHVLHDWDEPQVRLLLERSFEALPPGGRVAIFDAHLNPEKTGPLAVAEYSVLLMATTRGRCYGVGELRTLLETLGFTAFSHQPIAAHRSLVLARKPAAP